MRNKIITELNVVEIFLGIYFITLPLDFLGIGNIGSVSKVLAILPVFFVLINFKKRVGISNIVVLLLSFLILAIISFLYTVEVEFTITSIKTLALNTIMVLILGIGIYYDDHSYNFLKGCLIIGSWFATITLLIFGIKNFGRTTIGIGNSHQDPNYLCGFMIFAFSYHLNEFINSKKKIHLFLVFAIFMAVIISGSRGALLAFLLSITSMILIEARNSDNKVKVYFFSIMVCLIAYFLVSFILFPMIDASITERFTVQYIIEKGTTGRFEIWKYLIEKFKNSSVFIKLFGNGYGTTRFVNDLYSGQGGKVAHNLYIDTLTTLGILGASVLAFLHFELLRVSINVKDKFLICVMVCFIGMCCSLSLTSYKPLWVTIIMILIRERMEYEPDN